jgi:hypothetical protein
VLLSATAGPPVYWLLPGIVEDSYGDPVESWDAPERKRLHGAAVQEVTSVEDDDSVRPLLTDERRLFVPGKVPIRPEHRIESDGDVWRVDGKPITRRGLASSVYTTATLRRLSGGANG